MSPSIAFVETPLGTGSGILIEGGYVLTNAHVVWPYSNVRVVFPDGTEFSDAPVLSWDMMGDLAVIGPIETSLRPLALVAGEDLVIGSDSFLIGYPGEQEEFPAPTLTRGLISRLREWEPIGLTYFQTDATIAGGQSGGALVSEKAEVIGLSGFRFTEAGFGLVASSEDILPRVEALISGEDAFEIGERRLPTGRGKSRYDVTIRNPWDAQTYLINEAEGTTVDLTATGGNEVGFVVFDSFGNIVQSAIAPSTPNGKASGSFEIQLDSPYFAFPFIFGAETGDLRFEANRRIVPVSDPDDGQDVLFGQPVVGSMDHPLDIDFFNIELAEGDSIEITVDSVNVDPVLWVAFPGSTFEQRATDNDSGGGIFGTNAKLEYTAPHSGSFLIIVQNAFGGDTGGYFLTVIAPDAESQSEAYALSLVESGIQKRQFGDVDKAIDLFSRAMELDPDLASAYLNRARAYMAQDDLDSALTDINTAVELDTDDPELLYQRVIILWKKMEYESALADARSAIALDDEYHDAYNMSALVRVSLGNYDEALADVNKALALKTRDNAYIVDTRAYVYLKRGEYQKALSDYRSVREEYEGSEYYLLGTGLAYHGLDEPEKAQDFLRDGMNEVRDVENPGPQLADLIAMAAEALDNLR